MIRHSMDVVKTAVEVLNPSQVPMITCDHPLYTLAKQIQWSWLTTHGENHFIVMFGGLHIEMTVLEIFWNAVGGQEHSFRHALPQVTDSSLYLLLKRAYTEYSKDLEHVMSLEDWHTLRVYEYPHFRFLSIILNLACHDLCESNTRGKLSAVC